MITQAQIEERIAEFVAACRRKGIKATHQRTEILRELVGSEEHPDAETIYKKVRKRIPSMSLDTVYRTLRFFEEEGLASRLGLIKEKTRFDANTAKHHHFVCNDCGLIRDFYQDTAGYQKKLPDLSELGFVDSVYIELRGQCKKCREKNKKGKS